MFFFVFCEGKEMMASMFCHFSSSSFSFQMERKKAIMHLDGHFSLIRFMSIFFFYFLVWLII